MAAPTCSSTAYSIEQTLSFAFPPHIASNLLSAGYWVIDTPGQPIPLRLPLQLDLLSVKNERLTVKVPTLRAQDLGVNFKS